MDKNATRSLPHDEYYRCKTPQNCQYLLIFGPYSYQYRSGTRIEQDVPINDGNNARSTLIHGLGVVFRI
jgi:hypothetical protein